MCWTCDDRRLSSEATRVKKVGLWLYDYFCNIFGVNKFWHEPLCKRVVIELISTVLIWSYMFLYE